jgi:hypothetical protein
MSTASFFFSSRLFFEEEEPFFGEAFFSILEDGR